MKDYSGDVTTIAKGTGITFFGKIFGSGIQYLYQIIIARMLGAESFGLFMLGIGIIEFVGLFSRMGLEGGL